MFVRDQLMTHTMLSKINQSNRVGKLSDQYYCPNQFSKRVCDYYDGDGLSMQQLYAMQQRDI